MKRLLAALLVLGLPVSSTPAAEWKTPPQSTVEQKVEDTLYVSWTGETDVDMLKQAQIDIRRALLDRKRMLSVTLLSPGGPVITSLEIARQVWLAREKGLVVEIQCVALCASGATFVLAAGTPGKRYISRYTFFVVHSVQQVSFDSRECLGVVSEPKTAQEKAINTILRIMRDYYMLFTGKPQSEVEFWLTCGNEQIGMGELAVSLGIADAVREQ